jgi:hypothetical protein
MKKAIIAACFALLLCACGGQEEEICAQSGIYGNCTYFLDHNGCEGKISVKSEWEGVLALNAVEDTFFCSELTWFEGPLWALEVPGANICEVNIKTTVVPVADDKVTGVGTVKVDCDTFGKCSYTASFECEK